jgi:outer membrane protein assembly factor BamB
MTKHLAPILATLAGAAHAQTLDVWSHAAAGPQRVAVAGVPGPGTIATAQRIVSSDALGRPVSFTGQGTPIVTPDLVIAPGSLMISGSPAPRLLAFDRRTGQNRWAASVPPALFSSWSSAAFDGLNRGVLFASGQTLFCLDEATGQTRWSTSLPRAVVNASPLVTSTLGPRNRVFITDYSGAGASAQLHCINADPFHPTLNPYQPGQVVWSFTIGASSGNSPALAPELGLVFVATAGLFGQGPGRVLAFRADDTANPPTPLWDTQNPIAEAFFGGLAYARAADGPAVYAASYAFFGSTDSANLVKLDARTGAVRWSIACNRTASVPVPLPDGRVLLSTGIAGFGSVPALQLFADTGSSAQILWDSSFATWVDLNANGQRDPGEFTPMGGWAHQPGVRGKPLGTHALTVFVGSPADPDGLGPAASLYALTLDRLPGGANPGPAWLAQTSTLAGGSPALSEHNLYAIGPQGLVFFGPPPPQFDVDADGSLTIDDLYAWSQGRGRRDVNLDGAVNAGDRVLLESRFRRDEAADTRHGRP